MTEHNININTKYFEPVHDGKITLLIFDKKIADCKPGDTITLRNGNYTVSKKIKKTEIKSFGDLTEQEAKAAGFINKDFLKDELIDRFDIGPFDFLTGISENLIYCIYLQLTNTKYTMNMYTIKEDELDEKIRNCICKNH